MPFAALSTLFVTSGFDKAYAASTEVFKPAASVVASINPLSKISDTWDNFIAWLQSIPHSIAEFSVNLMGDLYELSASLILKTPLWLFDNQWFHDTTYQFSIFAIGIVSVLTAIEGIKRMLSGFKLKNLRSTMDLKTIAKRWGIVAGVVASAPVLFQQAFKVLNWLSDKIIAMGGATMGAVAAPEVIKLFDVITLLIFDVVLIATIIPVLWKNGRRFFDIMVLGVITPFALTAWIFDSYKHLFSQWWNNLKHLSLVQIYYALFLLMLGWFIFGVPTPETFSGMVIKILVVIGGFARMTNPPRIISKHLDSGGGFDELFSGIKDTKKNFKSNVNKVKDISKGPIGWGKAVWRISNPSPKVVAGTTRMARYHGGKK